MRGGEREKDLGSSEIITLRTSSHLRVTELSQNHREGGVAVNLVCFPTPTSFSWTLLSLVSGWVQALGGFQKSEAGAFLLWHLPIWHIFCRGDVLPQLFAGLLTGPAGPSPHWVQEQSPA